MQAQGGILMLAIVAVPVSGDIVDASLSDELEVQMIKIISYVVIAFSYRKANILHRCSNILRIFYGNNGLCHCCRSW